jgi:hypothetical protein
MPCAPPSTDAPTLFARELLFVGLQSSKDKSLYIKPEMLCRFPIVVFIEGDIVIFFSSKTKSKSEISIPYSLESLVHL